MVLAQVEAGDRLQTGDCTSSRRWPGGGGGVLRSGFMDQGATRNHHKNRIKMYFGPTAVAVSQRPHLSVTEPERLSILYAHTCSRHILGRFA